VPGGADDSYGVEVARLAGLPDSVIARARAVLKKLEEGGNVKIVREVKEEPLHQVSMEHMAAREIIEILKNADINTFTPIEALNMLYNLNQKVK
jgi:DNA mismatch repair protein MutS